MRLNRVVLCVFVISVFSACSTNSPNLDGGVDLASADQASASDASAGDQSGVDAASGDLTGTDSQSSDLLSADLLPPTATIEQFCNATDDFLCNYGVTCGLFASKKTCQESYNARYFPICFEAERPALKNGRLKFDSVVAAKCVEAIKTTSSYSCAKRINQPLPAACNGTIVTTLKVGDACYYRSECGFGRYCSSSDQTCPGVCVAAKGPGETANSFRECREDLYLYNGVCIEYVGLHGSCAAVQPETQTKLCASGLYCTSGTCEMQKAEDSVCMRDSECASELVCTGGKCVKRGVIGSVCDLTVGAPGCTPDISCQFTDFSMTGLCAATGGDGFACFLEQDCLPNFYCAGASIDQNQKGACRAQKAAGADCSPNTSGECSRATYCNKSTTKCTARPAKGQNCTLETGCAGLTACSGGTCQPFDCRDPNP